MSLTSADTLSSDATFLGKVKVAMVFAAIAVQAEDPSGLALPVSFAGSKSYLHVLRSRQAARILADQTTWGPLFARAVACDPNGAGINAASIDADIQFTVNSVFNAFSVQP
jgi:hypothetical protein